MKCWFLIAATATLVGSSCDSQTSEDIGKSPTQLDEALPEGDIAAIRAWVRTPPAPKAPSRNDPFLAAVQRQCQRCHMLGDPEQLTQDIWVNKILPEMGCYLGMHEKIPAYKRFVERGRTASEKSVLEAASLYPSRALIEQSEWDAVVNYFLKNSPAEAPESTNKSYPPLPPGRFSVEFIGPKNPAPHVTFIRIDEKEGGFITSGEEGTRLSRYDAEGTLVETVAGPGTIVDSDPELGRFLDVGTLHPNDELTGKVWVEGVPLPIDPLKRPVSFLNQDLDGDGVEEMVIAEYGNKTGQLSLFTLKEGEWKRQLLNQKSGNCDVKAADINQDGLMDLVVLRAQESEDVLVYYNTGELNFLQSTVLKFPSYWGLNEIELADLNSDGNLDMVLVNGDNGDSSNILKNYHGVRVYLGDGKGGFPEHQSVPLHGAFGVEISDHDTDTDLDLIVYSAFPDFRSDQPSLHVLEQGADSQFTVYSVPESASSRWMSMDMNDIDGDGDADVILGGFVPGPSSVPTRLIESAAELPNQFLLLKNQAK